MQRFWIRHHDKLRRGSRGHPVAERLCTRQPSPPSLFQDQQPQVLERTEDSGTKRERERKRNSASWTDGHSLLRKHREMALPTAWRKMAAGGSSLFYRPLNAALRLVEKIPDDFVAKKKKREQENRHSSSPIIVCHKGESNAFIFFF